MGMTNDGLSHWQAENAGDPLLNITIGDLLDRRAREIADQEAIVYSCYPEFGGALDIRWSYAEYGERVDEVARGLIALGLNKGEHIAIWAENIPEWPLLQLAAAKVGVVLIMVNPAYRAEELEYVLQQGEAAALFFMDYMHDHDCLKTVSSLVSPGLYYGAVSSERLPQLRYVCLLGTPPPGKSGHLEAWRPALFREMVAGSSYVSQAELMQRQAKVESSDPAILHYTSGTTGLPKGALLTHFGIVNNAIGFTSSAGTRPEDHICSTMPFFHIGGYILSTIGTLFVGATLHPMIAFDPQKMMEIISTERCTSVGAVPTMLQAVLSHPDFERYDLSCLRRVVSGGAPVPPSLIEQVQERIGTNMVIVFGQAEASAVITMTQPDDPLELKAATVGVPLPHIEVKIIDLTSGRLVPCGEQGELCCRGYLVMKGYYKMPEETREAIDEDGWLHTGDLATMDSRGYIRIVGRLKEVIIRGGENIFSREIEDFLMRHPQIANAQVVGVPDKFFGEELLAVLLLKEGEASDEGAIRAYCQGKISEQKIPRYFQFVDSYPMTASGTIQKYILRQNAIRALGLEETVTA
jgi:fatty-acyl-CoA synthase